MRALKENLARGRCAELSEFTYLIYRQKRRLGQSGERAPLEPLTNGGTGLVHLRHSIAKRGRFWNVIDPTGALVCVTVYKRGAVEVSRRLDPIQIGEPPATL